MEGVESVASGKPPTVKTSLHSWGVAVQQAQQASYADVLAELQGVRRRWFEGDEENEYMAWKRFDLRKIGHDGTSDATLWAKKNKRDTKKIVGRDNG